MRILLLVFGLTVFSCLFAKEKGPWGKDAALCTYKTIGAKKNLDKPNAGRRGACSLIRFYQTKISPIDGPRSHFVPSSSEYTRQAIMAFGLFGVALGCDRLLRENSETWIYPLSDRRAGTFKLDPIPIKLLQDRDLIAEKN